MADVKKAKTNHLTKLPISTLPGVCEKLAWTRSGKFARESQLSAVSVKTRVRSQSGGKIGAWSRNGASLNFRSAAMRGDFSPGLTVRGLPVSGDFKKCNKMKCRSQASINAASLWFSMQQSGDEKSQSGGAILSRNLLPQGQLHLRCPQIVFIRDNERISEIWRRAFHRGQ